MLMLSGYTLGFFFPRQAGDREDKAPAASSGKEPAHRPPEAADTRPGDEPERAETPFAFYFYRYF